jgi:hypothetical protein
MKRCILVLSTVLAFAGCSSIPPHHLPDSEAYKQQETEVLTAVCGKVMRHEFFWQRATTRNDTIAIYDSLTLPAPLLSVEIRRINQEPTIPDRFLCLLTDTTNWTEAGASVIHPPIKQMSHKLAFTPKLISPNNYDRGIYYRLSRVVFNSDFSQAYFQVTWSDPGGGARQLVLCEKAKSGWLVKAVYAANSFKI